MRVFLEVVAMWIAASCVIGPCLTWLFWYGERRRQNGRVRRSAYRLPASPMPK
jgi:hypothetical protein